MDPQPRTTLHALKATLPTGQVAVRSSRIPGLKASFANISKKAARFGQAPLTLETHGETVVFFPAIPPTLSFHGKMLDPGRRAFFEPYTAVTVTGDSFHIKGWRPVLRMERIDGATFFESLGTVGTTIPEHYRQEQEGNLPCEHCNTNRRRKESFVLLSQAGDWKVVGSTCLVDFTGHPDALGLAMAMSGYSSAAGSLDEDDGWLRTWTPMHFPTEDVLALTARYIRAYGWASRKQAMEAYNSITPTADMVNARMTAIGKTREEMVAAGTWLTAEAEDEALAAATRRTVMERLAALPSMTEFEHNLFMALQSDHTPTRIMGTVCALFAVAERYISKEAAAAKNAEAAAKATHIGEVKQRMTLKVWVQEVRDLGRNEWGDRLLYKMQDADGNRYAWFTGVHIDVALATWFTAAFTIKAHTTYQGIKENQVTRLSVKEVHAPAKPANWSDLPIADRILEATRKGMDPSDAAGRYFVEHGTRADATHNLNHKDRTEDHRRERFRHTHGAAIEAARHQAAREARAKEEGAKEHTTTLRVA